jgi:adenine-specific DNA-methyltransferase
MNTRYRNLDNDPRGVWKPENATAQAGHGTRSQFYELAAPNGKKHSLPNGRCWVYTEEVFQKMVAENRVWFGIDGNNVPAIKRFLSEVKQGTACQTIWKYNEVGHNQDAKKEIKDLFPEELAFDTPKPSTLIDRILQVGTDKNSIVLDSFSGSGTTAHSVIKANKRDGGNRKFIMVEMEEYADNLTAERVRRVIKGYDFTGTQKTELLRQKLSWTQLKKADALVKSVDGIENLHGHEYDKINKTVKNGELIVTGEKKVKDKADGLGGEFTYCTLGPPVELDKILTGETLPTYEGLGAVLYHTATNTALDPATIAETDFYLGESDGPIVWLIYKPDLDWLKSPDAAFTLSFARKIVKMRPDKRHLVFAPSRFVSQKMLDDQNLPVEFAPLPFALYRIERG